MSHTRLHADGAVRCIWVTDDPEYVAYHDNEWGQRGTGQRDLFEAIALEGFQAGLSWLTILKRREGFRSAFYNFDIDRVANLESPDIDRLMQNPAIIRNRAKILATIHNARVIREQDLDLKTELWSFAPKQRLTPVKNFEWRAVSEESIALSKHLRKLGFKFVGPTTIYALMQSTGMIHDHAPDCNFRE